MLKKILVLLFSIALAACSSVKVIDLDKDKIDQKSYASAYEATVATYKGRVNENFYVDNFASGAIEWSLGRSLVRISQLQDEVYVGGPVAVVCA